MLNKKQFIQAGLAATSCLFIFACGSVQNLPSVSNIDPGPGACPAGIGGMDPSCCNAGVAISPPPSAVCQVVVPGGPGVGNPILTGAGSAGTSVGENQAAATMVGGQKMGTFAGQSSAATAGQAPVNGALSGIGLPLGQNGLGVTASGNANAGTGGQSGNGDSGSVATAPTAISSPDPNALSGADGSSAAQGAQYAGGGGYGLLPNGAHSTGFLFGNGLGGDAGAGAAAEIAFGAQRNLASMNGEDPADYFTRIGLEDSLFKKVEKRYRSTSANWETASLNPVRAKAPK